ncbi:MAG: hypothetical protein ACKOKC_14955, partial [Chthoniobacterales bacterium]
MTRYEINLPYFANYIAKDSTSWRHAPMNRRLIPTVVLSVLCAALAYPPQTSAKEPAPVGKQNAGQLLQSAQESLAYTTKAARNAGEKLSPESPTAKPFLLSLKKINDALGDADAGLKEKKPEFFEAVDAARSGVAEMQATWDLTGSDDKNVMAGAKKLGGDIIALHENYSPLAARRAKGGELTAAEKAKFDKIKAQQTELDKKLAALAAKYTNNKALSAGVKQIRDKANRIAKAKPSVASYTGAIDLLSSIAGMIAGYSYYVPASARSEWVTIQNQPSSWSYYESVYEEYSYEWSSVEESVEIYDSESIEVSETEMTEEESYLEETDFDLTDEQESEVAEESDDIAEDEINADDLESEQEEVAQDEEDEELAPADDSGDETDDSVAD